MKQTRLLSLYRLPDLFLFILLFLITFTPLSNFDFFWHLKTGDLMLAQGHFFYSDPFSYTAFDAPWFNFHILFQVSVSLIHRYFGFNGLTLYQVFLFFLIFTVCCHDGKNTLGSRLLILFALLCLSKRHMLRPELGTILFLVLYIRILLSPSKKFFFLPLLQILFTNTHSAFYLGPVLILFKFLESFFHRKLFSPAVSGRYGMILFFSVLACAVSPYGFKGMLFPVALVSKVTGMEDVYKKTILEFASPDLLGKDWIYGLYFVLCIAFLVRFIKDRNYFASLVILFTGFLAFSAARNFNLLLFCSLPFLLQSDLQVRLESLMGSIAKKIILAGVVMIAVLYGYLFASNRYYLEHALVERSGWGINRTVFSDSLPDFLKGIPSTARMFNSMSLGGYLIYHAPHLKVFYDGRLDVYSEDFYRLYLKMISDHDVFTAQAKRFRIDLVILNHSINEGAPLMRLKDDPDWELAYLDYHTVVFMKKGSFPGLQPITSANKDVYLAALLKRTADFAPCDRELMKEVLFLALEKLSL
ncbi:MAG: hypothetical protein JW774_07370 [Candidatus Aureabacteria bacterium]|nr:hypothetical protein [Candidatus Auribacterota bacterium]